MASSSQSISTFSLYVLLAVLLSTIISSHSQWDLDRRARNTNEICSKTQNQTFCYETLGWKDAYNYVDYNGYINYNVITRVAIDRAREHANNTSNQINTALLVGNERGWTTRHHQYTQCSMIYEDDAVTCLKEISGFMDGHQKYESAMAKAVKLQVKGNECDRALGTTVADPLDLHRKNLRMVDYGSVVWAAIETQLRHSHDSHLER